MDVSENRGGGLRSEKLGRVAKVAGDPSCLGCIGLPPAQRDAGRVFDLGEATEQALPSEPVAVADLR